MAKILVTYDMFREGFTELESNYDVTFPKEEISPMKKCWK